MPDHHVRGVLFDAGGVLTRPIGGRWNPRYDFESIVMTHHPGVREALFPAAVDAGQRFLDASPTTANRTAYHRAMLTVLGVPDPSPELPTSRHPSTAVIATNRWCRDVHRSREEPA
ncbi:hypothetical protein AB0H83_49085 [Dactylosporangium sp. NPDC050688]|uniref:hypothetical protein n=1 Tax=Dactylosporangium sp. NPDC050688 TaxID=3157217 RepID=UPI0033D3CA15